MCSESVICSKTLGTEPNDRTQSTLKGHSSNEKDVIIRCVAILRPCVLFEPPRPPPRPKKTTTSSLACDTFIFYCVFKAFIFIVMWFAMLCCDVFSPARVADTHGVNTTSDWLLFFQADPCSAVSLWLQGTRRTSSIFVQFIQQLTRANKSAFFFSNLINARFI